MKKKLLFIIFTFIIFNQISLAQRANIDSLLILTKTEKPDTNKVIHLNTLCWEYTNLGNYDTAVVIGKEAFILGEKLGFKKGVAVSYSTIGIIYYRQSNYPEALKNYFASLKIRETINDKKGIASSYNNIGNVYYRQGNYPEALKNHYASLKIQQEIGNKKGISSSYNNIGTVYYDQGNFTEALKIYSVALKIQEVINDYIGIANSYNNIGNIYDNQGNYKEALKNQFASLKIEEEIGDKSGISSSYNNIGNAFTKLASLEKNSVNKQKKLIEAEQYLIKARDLSKEIGYKKMLAETYNAFSRLDSTRGNYKGAYENHKLYIIYRDSLDNEETKKKTIQSQMTYDFEKKEIAAKVEQDKKDALAAEEKQKQKIITYSISAGLFLVLLLALFILRGYRQKQKANLILGEKNKIIEEKNKNITDSITYAQRIQQAVLASNELLNDNLSNFFILFKPKDIVSGDFYWGTNSENDFYLAICDSTGHGVPGAFMSLLNISFLNEAINQEKIVEPNKIFDHVRNRLIENISHQGGARDGMDGILVRFEKNNENDQVRLTYAAANNAPVLIRNGELTTLACDKMPVGKSERKIDFQLSEVLLQKGDILYFYTDGYADQFGGTDRKKFMGKQLKKLLFEHSDKHLKTQKEILERTLKDWKNGIEQIDDVLVIGIKI